MKLRPVDIPEDSSLHLWVQQNSITEVPLSYQIFTGLSMIGAVMKRNAWVDQGTLIFPNLPVLLVGPSGIGKDVILGRVQKALSFAEGPPDVTARTIELTFQELLKVGDPAAALVFAPELTQYLGEKDYQKGMDTELTNLLSCGDYVQVGIKGTGFQVIPRPTITVYAGSTATWLAKKMPKGGVAGGFLPRFVVITEGRPKKFVPWVKYGTDRKVYRAAQEAGARWKEWLYSTREIYNCIHGEFVPLTTAQELYSNFYINRFDKFHTTVEAYANRSRDMALRFAMICAVSRRKSYIDTVDMEFALKLVDIIAESLQTAIVPILEDEASKQAWIAAQRK